MDSADIVLVIVVGTALAFDFTNGFHDTANAVATSISTRAMSPRFAVALSAVLNFAGAFISLEVAATVAQGIVEAGAVSTTVIFAGLVGAIAWNLATWWLGLPSSSSHALIGGVVGAAFAADGTAAVKGGGLVDKVLVPGVVAPILAFAVGRADHRRLLRDRRAAAPGPGQPRLPARPDRRRRSMFSLAHGTNDAQKTMGIITLALIAHGDLPSTGFDVPAWVIVSSATAIALGTYTGGWRIIRTMGSRIIKMDPAQGFAAQSSGAAVILTASHLGFPLSTTHVISGAVMGAGRGQAAVGRTLGRGRQHRRRLGPDPACRGADRGARVRRQLAVRRQRRRPAGHHPGHDRRDRRRLRPPRPGPARAGRGMNAAIDSGALLELLWVAPLAAVAIALCFSLVIVGVTKAGDCRRAERPRAASAYAVLSVVATALFLGVVLFGLSVIAHGVTRRGAGGRRPAQPRPLSRGPSPSRRRLPAPSAATIALEARVELDR